jgi:hypothetical protein
VEHKEEPHSRRSDSHSIGKTILEVGHRVTGSKFPSHASRACRVAEAPCRDDDPRARLTLDQALEEIEQVSAFPLQPQPQPPPPPQPLQPTCAPSGAVPTVGGARQPALVSRPRSKVRSGRANS